MPRSIIAIEKLTGRKVPAVIQDNHRVKVEGRRGTYPDWAFANLFTVAPTTSNKGV